METKFIGIDGFGEIESFSQPSRKVPTEKRPQPRRELSTAQKTVRFVKRAAAMHSAAKNAGKASNTRQSTSRAARPVNRSASPSTISKNTQVGSVSRRYHTFNYTGTGTAPTMAPRTSTVHAAKTAGRRHYAHLAEQDMRKTKLIKSKAVLASAACLSAVMVMCLTVGAVDGSNGGSNDSVETTAAAVSTNDEIISDSISSGAAAADLSADYSALYIDGNLIGTTDETDELNAALDKVLEDYKSGYDEQTTTEFANEVEVVPAAGTSQIISVDELMELAEDKFSISLSTDIVYTREVEYDTDVEYDEDKSSSYEEVTTEGENGEEEVTVRATFVDGVQTNSEIIDTEVVKEAVNEVVVKGSSDESADDEDDDEDDDTSSSSSMFEWPLPYTHTLSSYFGQRWGRLHGGIDISDSDVYGQSICAAASGTVTFAGSDDSGYGTYVIIDHGNGYVTLYGHCSALAVSTGDTVSQGDVIAYVGSTGNSTGPHLHFEIRIDGTKVDPLEYVS